MGGPCSHQSHLSNDHSERNEFGHSVKHTSIIELVLVGHQVLVKTLRHLSTEELGWRVQELGQHLLHISLDKQWVVDTVAIISAAPVAVGACVHKQKLPGEASRACVRPPPAHPTCRGTCCRCARRCAGRLRRQAPARRPGARGSRPPPADQSSAALPLCYPAASRLAAPRRGSGSDFRGPAARNPPRSAGTCRRSS